MCIRDSPMNCQLEVYMDAHHGLWLKNMGIKCSQASTNYGQGASCLRGNTDQARWRMSGEVRASTGRTESGRSNTARTQSTALADTATARATRLCWSRLLRVRAEGGKRCAVAITAMESAAGVSPVTAPLSLIHI
eukprot:TRINITY_DN65118_c0_g1_i1.p2 TRINITY_DN65118_c0_g1~~TRINITY_DN65118_c0_g1_i1.p2  ORF type:complete len:135 (+),score=23.53 TRINITY_DN65118_c0_g1_i1:88-492(+)